MSCGFALVKHRKEARTTLDQSRQRTSCEGTLRIHHATCEASVEAEGCEKSRTGIGRGRVVAGIGRGGDCDDRRPGDPCATRAKHGARSRNHPRRRGNFRRQPGNVLCFRCRKPRRKAPAACAIWLQHVLAPFDSSTIQILPQLWLELPQLFRFLFVLLLLVLDWKCCHMRNARMLVYLHERFGLAVQTDLMAFTTGAA
jgi:hypothetical protein